MAVIFLALLLFLTPASSWAVVTDACWDWRQTSGFVTDPSPCIFEGGSTYPNTYSSGVSGGWSTSMAAQGRDRNSGIDARLAGITFLNNTAAKVTFRVDLSTMNGAGTYDIDLAAGDNSNSQIQFITIKDDTTDKINLMNGGSGYSTSSAQWLDANATVHTSAANWVSSHTTVRVTFSSTNFVMEIGQNGAAGLSTAISHLRLTSVPSATFFRRRVQ